MHELYIHACTRGRHLGSNACIFWARTPASPLHKSAQLWVSNAYIFYAQEHTHLHCARAHLHIAHERARLHSPTETCATHLHAPTEMRAHIHARVPDAHVPPCATQRCA